MKTKHDKHSDASRTKRSGGHKRSPSKSRKGSLQVNLPRDYPWLVLGAVKNCLSEHLTAEELSHLDGVIRSRDWDNIDRLGGEWSLQRINSATHTEWQPETVARRVMLGSLIRKYVVPSDAERLQKAAIDAFMRAEKQCSDANRDISRRLILSGEEFGHAKWFLAKLLGPVLPEFSALSSSARHGPGVNISTTNGCKSRYDKYSGWPYRCTAACLPHARRLIASDERWLGALEESYRRKRHIPPWKPLDQDRFWSEVLLPTEGNRITTVRKSRSTDRPIAIEPDINLMLQLGTDGFIRRRLKRWGIDLDSQVKNQVLALQGSAEDSWLSPVTIDLASASDTISMRVAKELLPVPWYRYLCDLRSPKGTLPDGTNLRYSKLSSMGNGATFAIESAIFASISYGVCKKILGRFPRESVGIYGDDLIVPKICAAPLCNALRLSGFSINTDKSFLEGPARESCGSDFYLTHPVRGVFLTKPPTNVMELFADRNRIFRWLNLHGYYNSHELDKLYQRWIPTALKGFVGPCSDEEFDTYWHSRVCPGVTDPSGQYTINVLHASLGERGPISAYKAFLGEAPPGALPRDCLPFVKLAASLRIMPTRQKWEQLLETASGSAFDVPSNRIRRRKTTRLIYNWSIGYQESIGSTPRGVLL